MGESINDLLFGSSPVSHSHGTRKEKQTRKACGDVGAAGQHLAAGLEFILSIAYAFLICIPMDPFFAGQLWTMCIRGKNVTSLFFQPVRSQTDLCIASEMVYLICILQSHWFKKNKPKKTLAVIGQFDL